MGHKTNPHNKAHESSIAIMDELVEQAEKDPNVARLLARVLNLGLIFDYRWSVSDKAATYLDSILFQRMHALSRRRHLDNVKVEKQLIEKGEHLSFQALVDLGLDDELHLYADGQLDPVSETVDVPFKSCGSVNSFKNIDGAVDISALYHDSLFDFLYNGGFSGLREGTENGEGKEGPKTVDFSHYDFNKNIKVADHLQARSTYETNPEELEARASSTTFTPKRKYLVFCAAGDHSVIASWTKQMKEERQFDLIIGYYGNTDLDPSLEVDYWFHKKGRKHPMLKYLHYTLLPGTRIILYMLLYIHT